MIRTSCNQDKELIRLFFENIVLKDTTWIFKWIQENFNPENIFSESTLKEWANRNGYSKVINSKGVSTKTF